MTGKGIHHDLLLDQKHLHRDNGFHWANHAVRVDPSLFPTMKEYNSVCSFLPLLKPDDGQCGDWRHGVHVYILLTE